MSLPRSENLMRRLGMAAPLLLSPMAGVADAALAIAVARAGGLGAIAAATLSIEQLHEQTRRFRDAVDAPLNLNFFAHTVSPPSPADIERWRAALAPLHEQLGLSLPTQVAAGRQPFDAEALAAVEALRPQLVSFHFGLPDASLLERVKATGAFVLSSATTVAEARWLQARGADAIIAQGWEAGGHRGMFLDTDVGAQAGTLSLLPQIVDAVEVPVIAAGGIADGRGLAAALMLGASAVQVGTAFLRSPEARTSPAHRAALATSTDDATRVTNVFTGRPARGLLNRLMRELGPMSSEAIAFPYAGSLLAALREHDPGGDFVPLWAGQSAPLAKAIGAEEITRGMIDEALDVLRDSGASSASWAVKRS